MHARKKKQNAAIVTRKNGAKEKKEKKRPGPCDKEIFAPSRVAEKEKRDNRKRGGRQQGPSRSAQVAKGRRIGIVDDEALGDEPRHEMTRSAHVFACRAPDLLEIAYGRHVA